VLVCGDILGVLDEGPDWQPERGEIEWEPLNIPSQKNTTYIPISTLRVTLKQAEAHTNKPLLRP
jgi:hypothetical protein